MLRESVHQGTFAVQSMMSRNLRTISQDLMERSASSAIISSVQSSIIRGMESAGRNSANSIAAIGVGIEIVGVQFFVAASVLDVSPQWNTPFSWPDGASTANNMSGIK